MAIIRRPKHQQLPHRINNYYPGTRYLRHVPAFLSITTAGCSLKIVERGTTISIGAFASFINSPDRDFPD